MPDPDVTGVIVGEEWNDDDGEWSVTGSKLPYIPGDAAIPMIVRDARVTGGFVPWLALGDLLFGTGDGVGPGAQRVPIGPDGSMLIAAAGTGAWVPRLSGVITAETALTANASPMNVAGVSAEAVLATLGTIPGDSLKVGSLVEFAVGLRIEPVNSATARNVRFRIRIGGLTGPSLLDTTNTAFQISTGATDVVALRGHWIQRTIGPGTSATAAGVASMPNRFYSATNDKVNPFGNSAGFTANFNSGANQAIVLTVQESVVSVADVYKSESGFLRMT